jgi:hypothetical protein
MWFNNAALTAEVRRTFTDRDEIEGQLKKAGTAIEKVQALTAKYRSRLTVLCDRAATGREMPERKNGRVRVGNGNGTQERLLREGGRMVGAASS